MITQKENDWAEDAKFTSERIQSAIKPLQGTFDLTMFDENEGNFTLKGLKFKLDA